ncbi:hypothetical protein JMJ35_008145 [Cladonia borealis]|uniref:Extracellular membrane protein CFEM domain-containing protein n=1 Tax=Cladonia borealis TaxID=184061 RepID=A0AA39QXQ4_9LECA|nr:hypothetical protein JMJ35_008145 [Cladonia borealis]
MRIVLGLIPSLTLIVLTNAGFDPDVDVVPTEPKVEPEPAPEPAPEPDPHPDDGSPTDGSSPTYDSPLLPNPGGTGEDESESDIGETLSDILDAITSIISDVIGGTTTITSAASLPTAAHPCLSAQDIYNSCALQTSGFNTTAATIQANCLCYQNQNQNQNQNQSTSSSWVPGLFDGFLASCNNYVQEQTQLVTLPVLETLTAFCTTAGNVRVSTTAAVSITPAVPTAAATTAPQELPPSKGVATALSPVLFSRGRYMLWTVVLALVGLSWIGYS